MRFLTIGQLARAAGVGVETVRFYERRGLLAPPPRSAAGYRQYTDDTVARLQFIRRAKELGFTLSEIQELLALRERPTARCAEVKSRAEAKIASIDQKIRDLQRMKRSLKKLADICPGETVTEECPILESLTQPSGSATDRP